MAGYKESDDPWASWGITDQPQFRYLFYNSPSKSLVAQFYKRLPEGYGIYSLYFRSTKETVYEMIPRPDDFTSYDSPFCCQSSPFLIFLVRKYRKVTPPNDKEWYGADWVSINRMNLITKEVSTVLPAENLKLSSGIERAWVGDILAIWEKGEGATCSVGLERRLSEDHTTVDYWVCDIHFASGVAEMITALPGVFI